MLQKLLMSLTIFTPTYNRANNLPALYKSLCRQTCKDFEWLIVDDGSTDNTSDIVRNWQKSDIVKIRYVKQQNGGKHRAINRGVTECSSDLFFIVDSDDFLTEDAVEWISGESDSVMADKNLAGLSGTRISPDGSRIGGVEGFSTIETSYLNLRLYERISGDMAEIYKTDVLKAYPFLEFDGEKFCPEALVWNRISQKYKVRFVNKGIYVCEYLPGGLTDRIIKIRHDSPLTSMVYYSELVHYEIPLVQKLKGSINYWRFAPFKYYSLCAKHKMLSFISLLSLPVGLLYRFKDSIQ